MKLATLLQQPRRSLSFEVFPPKTSTVFASIQKATFAIARQKPSFISVTYGAGGGTSAYTLEMAREIQDQFQVPALAHLTCVSSSRETVARRIREIQAASLENVMALRGDLTPELEASDRSQWCYHHAVELVREIRSLAPELCIGGACYPEVHPESPNQREDIARLKEKVEAGCEFLTSQMFFDNNLFYNFLYKIREAGILVPVLPGVMPITKASQVERAIRLSGSFMPQRFKSLVDCFGENPEAMQQAGIAYATDQIIDLFANGIHHVHVYSMNNPAVAAKILENLSRILEK
ncbi:MAG: methylenetetrahydrofolate reductase [Oligosphaeraceae bacterium]